jgi:hypothetical protein
MNARANTTIDASEIIRPSMWGVGSAKFGESPVIDSHLFQVNPQIPVSTLLGHAQCMAVGVRETLLNVDDNLDGNQAWLLWNALDQLVGILRAIEIASKKAGG